jgi:hypothetical protein
VVELIIRSAPDSLAEAVSDALPRFSTELLASASDLAQRVVDALPADAPPELRIPMNPNTRYDVFEHLGSEAAERPTRGRFSP